MTTPATPVPARPAPPPVGRWILLTGASGGIGRATALRLADVGRVVFAAARRADQLRPRRHPGVRPVVLDVTHAASIDRARDQIMAETGGYGLEVLVNAAGILVLGPVEAVFQTTGQRLDGLLRRAVPLLSRGSLGVTFVWFGALKLAGADPARVADRRDHPVRGSRRVGAAGGRLRGPRSAPGCCSAAGCRCSWPRPRCLAGTFLVLVLRPDVAFVDGNPLRLGVEVGTWSRTSCCWPRPPPWPCTRSPPDRSKATDHRLADVQDPDSGTPTAAHARRVASRSGRVPG